MLIPSIDLQNGRIVQLVQGEKLAVESHDVSGWIEKFSKFPKVQLIDLDAAMSRGDRKSTRLNSSHIQKSRMPSSA